MKHTVPLRLLKESEGQVRVPEAVCQALGFEEIWARPVLDVRAAVLLAELKDEACGHSWRTALSVVESRDAEGLVQAVKEAARVTRPTILYTYWGISSEGEAPIAIAALSSHIRHGFPHDGFPVVARCTIRRCYRGHGLYPHLLRHRLDLCRELWGEKLMVIHIGAADPAVLATLSRADPDRLSFACVGAERLQIAGERYWVPDFLAATETFRQALCAELRDSDPRIGALARKVEDFLNKGASAVSYSALVGAVEGARAGHGEEWWQTCGHLAALMDLCQAIGVQTE
jgi:hypothetical protein